MMRKLYTTLFYTLAATISVSAQYSQQWHTELNGTGDFNDQINSIAIDSQGNSYLAGYTVNVGTDRDYLVAKVNSAGTLVWSKEFSAPGNGPDEAKKVLIHPNGNIIVTGYGNNKAVGNDFWTIALNPNGDTLWTSLHNSVATNLYDEANDMAIDSNGNIFIAGDSDNDPTMITNHDFMLVKYNASGNFIWEKKINGPANGEDRCAGVAIDSNNGIYLTGRSFNGGDDDFLTVKFDNAGTLIWSSPIDNGGTDRAVDIEVGANNNIYITGRSDNGVDDDYFSIIYSSTGSILSQAIYDFAGDDRPVALTTFANGDFAVTGKSDGNITTAIDNNAVTVRFTSTGMIVWTKSFSNVALSDDIPTAITSDNQGNVAVVGFSDIDATVNINNEIFMCQYNSSGTLLGSYISNNNPGTLLEDAAYAVAYKNGNVVLGGCKTINDITNARTALLLEYSSANNALTSSTTLNGNGDNTDNIRDILVDASGNSYICGYSVSNLTSRDFFVAKILANGTIGWRTTLTGTLFGSDDEANALAFDNVGNVVVNGFIKNSGTSSDIVLAKYSPAGLQLWSVVFDSPVHESDKSNAMVCDASGNIYLTGKTDIDPSWQINDEVFTAKYSSAGTVVWTKTYTGVGTGLDKGQFIQVTSAGNIYVIGKIQNNGNDNVLVIKYNNAGSQLWSTPVDISGGNDKVSDFLIDANENIVISGSSETSLNSTDHNCFTLLINSSGAVQWQKISGNTGIDLEETIAICSDNTHIFAAQNLDTDASLNEEIHTQVVKYDLAGNVVSTYLYNSANPTVADDILIDNFNTPVVLTHSNPVFSSDIDFQIEILKINSLECVLAETFSTSDSIDVGNVFKFLPNQLFIGGSTWHFNEQRNAMVVKYNFTDTQNIPDIKESTFSIYPNPVINTMQVASTSIISKVQIFDNTGKLVLTQFPFQTKQAIIDLSYLSSGNYVVVVEGNQSKETKNIIKN